MIDASFVKEILNLAKVECVHDDEGRKLYSKKLVPALLPEVVPLHCHTLSGLVDFYDTLNVEEQRQVVFHIVDFDKVAIVSDVFGPEKQREKFIVAESYSQENPFNRYFPHEDFMIKILSLFVQDDKTSNILRIVGNLKIEDGAQYSDDGLSQKITAKTGITKVERIDLPNPILLRPYRTFTDIEQPESSFVLRMRQDRGDSGILVALFEADGAAWKNKAIASIKSYLENRKIGAKIIA